MSHMISEFPDRQFPMETIRRTDGEAQDMSSWTNEDEGWRHSCFIHRKEEETFSRPM